MEWKRSQSRERAKPPIPHWEGLRQVHIATMSKRWAHHLGELREMSLPLVQNRALPSLEAASVTVEVHPAQRLAQLHSGGLADVEAKEARVRSAIQNAGLEFPR